MPQSQEEWIQGSNGFYEQWNFRHALGAIDGKHVLIQCPFNNGTDFLNYKSQISIVLMAVVDSDYNFLYAHIGSQGRISDGGVLKGCSLNDMIENRTLHIPQAQLLPNRNKCIPYILLVHFAFALSENLLKSGMHVKGSKERIFNYRQSKAGRVVENAFGILASVFRVLRKPMLLQPDKAQVILMAAIHLHNFLRRGHSRSVYAPVGAMDTENNARGDVTPGTWGNDHDITSFLLLPRIPRRSAASFKENREELSDYFLCEGKFPWQDRYA